MHFFNRRFLNLGIAKIDSPILLPTYFFCRTELTRQTGGQEGWDEKNITDIKLDLSGHLWRSPFSTLWILKVNKQVSQPTPLFLAMPRFRKCLLGKLHPCGIGQNLDDFEAYWIRKFFFVHSLVGRRGTPTSLAPTCRGTQRRKDTKSCRNELLCYPFLCLNTVSLFQSFL